MTTSAGKPNHDDYGKPIKSKGSIWDNENGRKPKKNYMSWPKPFNAVERITVLNCHEVMLLHVKFVAEIIGEFSFDAFVPSPFELFRNWVFGQLRCGSKMGVKTNIPGPGNLILNKQGKLMLAQIGGMIGVPLLYWSMAQTLFTAMNTWSTIRNTQAMCENPEAHAIMANGVAYIKHVGFGDIPLWDAIYDPRSLCDPTPGDIRTDTGKMGAWGSFALANNNGITAASIDIWLDFGAAGEGPRQHFDVPTNGFTQFQMSAYNGDCEIVRIKWENFTAIPGVVNFLELYGVYLAVATEDPDAEMYGSLGLPDPDPGPNCQAMFADGTPLP